MNNIIIGLTNFIKNKNTVTILGVISILGLLYFGYNSTIKKQTNPIRVPIAKVTIQPRTLITNDMIEYISVPGVSVSKNVIRSSSQLLNGNLYTAINTVIPAGSMFYTDVLVTKDKLPDSAIVSVPEGKRPYALAVTSQSTYGNSIFPGNVIDIYMKATDMSGQLVVGRLIEKAEVLAVKDASGQNVFENTAEARVPATLLFGVSDEIYLLLKRAEYLKNHGIELFPVPYGGAAKLDGLLIKDRQELVDLIDSLSIAYISSDELNNPTDNPIDNQTDNSTVGE